VVTPGAVTLQQVRDSWPEVLESVQKAKRSAWMVVFTAKPLELRENGVLVISFPSQKDVDALKQPSSPGEGVGDYLKQAISDLLGFRPALIARVEPSIASPSVAEPVEAPEPVRNTSVAEPVDAPRPVTPAPSTLRDGRPSTSSGTASSGTAGDSVTGNSDAPPREDDAPEPIEPDLEPDPEPPAEKPAAPESAPAVDANGWAVAQIPVSESDSAPTSARSARAEAAAAARAKAAEPDTSSAKQRYGESVVREILGASFIEEQTIAPRVTPRIDG
jgi:DNA polymerase-3 subunit gamma/tau